MKTLFAALAAATAVAAVAGPAAAHPHGYDSAPYAEQPWDGHDRGGVNGRQAWMEQRIERGLRTGALTAREAHRLHEEARDIARLEARYRVNGLNGWERADLDRRLDRLDAHIARESHDRDYGYGYGYRR